MIKYFSKKQTTTLDLNLLGVRTAITIPAKIEDHFNDQLTKYLPICEETSQNYKISEVQLKINIRQGNPRLRIDDDTATFYSNSNTKTLVVDSVFLVSKLLEKALNKKGIFSLHASGLSYGENGVLIVGPTGSGKTTTAVFTCLQDKTIGHVSGNRVFLDSNSHEIIYGIDRFSLRKTSILNEFKRFHVAKRVGLNTNNIAKGQLAHADKVSLTSAYLGIKRAKFPLKLERIIIIQKMDNELVTFDARKGGNTELLTVYSALTEFSERVPCMMVGPKILFPEVFGEQLKAKQLRFAVELTKTIPITYVGGGLMEISKFIENKIKAQQIWKIRRS